MEKKTLFEIPIYSMSEKEFNKRWNKKKLNFMICLYLMDILMRTRDIIHQLQVFRAVFGNIIRLSDISKSLSLNMKSGSIYTVP